MRIIAGSRARMNLLPPKDKKTRPITDRVKESLFNILRPVLQDALVADIFCGTGSLGLEALSRGAQHAIMVDRDRDALDRLRQNIEKLKFQDETSVLQTDAFKVGIPKPISKSSPLACEPRNLIFLDPPYRFSLDTELESQLGKLLIKLCTQIAPDSTVVVRHDKKAKLLETYDQLQISDYRVFGNMAITFLENNTGSETQTT